MNESCAIGLPGHRTMGTRVRLVISSVSVPLKPGSTKPAVAWTMSPRRPRLDLPSMRATTSSGSSTYSSVRPRTNSPGWMTNDSSSPTSTSSVRFCGGSARSMAAMRWLWKTRNELPRRRSTLAGWTMSSSHGSMRTRPSATRRRIVPSESTEVGGIRPKSASGRRPSALRVVGALGADDHRARAPRGGEGWIAVRSAARTAREGLARVARMLGAAVTALGLLLGLRLGLDGPPDDPQQPHDRDLEGEHEPQEAPRHVGHCTPAAVEVHARTFVATAGPRRARRRRDGAGGAAGAEG